MQYSICTYGNPALRQKALPVTAFDCSLENFTKDMLKIMKEQNGVGLAAEQIGEMIQVCVMDLDVKYDLATPDGQRLNPEISMPFVLVNPKILEKSAHQTNTEGCLSIPGIFAPVKRAFEISVSFRDIHNSPQKMKIKGFLAQVIQHEVDHLNGMLFIDRISPVKKISLSGKLKEMKKQTETKL